MYISAIQVGILPVVECLTTHVRDHRLFTVGCWPPLRVGRPADWRYFGVTRNRAPGLASSSIHSAPSGPTSTSRMRLPTLQRSAGLAPPLPSNVMRLSDWLPMPP